MVQRLALFSALAAAFGGVVGGASVVLRDAPPLEGVSGGARAIGRGDVPADPRISTRDPPGRRGVTRDGTRSLTQRIDSTDPDERDELALELLRRGPVALAQARALRPRGRPGRELQASLVDALQKMRALRRGGDYPRLAEHLRLRLDLDAFTTVVPEEWLRAERLVYWQLALDAVRARTEKGHALDGELALAEIELARVQRELGRIDGAAYAAVKGKRMPAVIEWIEVLRAQRGFPPTRVRSLEEQMQRL